MYQNRHSLSIWKDAYVFSLFVVLESERERLQFIGLKNDLRVSLHR